MFQLADAELDAYASRLLELIERYGISVTEPSRDDSIEIRQASDGSLSFELSGSLPDGRRPPLSTLVLRERFDPVEGDRLERTGYEYELIDHERDLRRGFHLHDRDWFEHRYLVIVHEHCERPIGHAPCPHLTGAPVRDGFAAVELLMRVWTGPPPDCAAPTCLGS